jgi:cytochrome c peroxidase
MTLTRKVERSRILFSLGNDLEDRMTMRRIIFVGIALFVAATAFALAAATRTSQIETTIAPRTNTAAIHLGRLLFWDPILSGNNDTACATCHHPDFAYADGRDLSRGTGSVGLGPKRVDVSKGQVPVVKRNSPTILNVAFNGVDDDDDDDDDDGDRRGRRRFAVTPQSVNQARAPMFWDSRVRSLETQALEPIKALEEMRGHAYPEAEAVDMVVARIRKIPEYVALFQEAFGPGTTVDGPRIGDAIAAFERSLVAMNSPFDRFRAGDLDALTAQQRRGLDTFDEVGCDRCHDGPMFSDFDHHAEGVPEHRLLPQPDAGAGRFRFRTPSLRNVALTAPYMHNGMLATLQDVLRFYDNGRSENPNVSNERDRDRGRDRGRNGAGIARVSGQFRRVDDMSESEMADITAFLNALTDTNFDRTIPARVPSGLPPGGLIR